MRLREMFAGLLMLVLTCPAVASESIVRAEREALAADCSEIEFSDGFVVAVDVNGDAHGDALVDYGKLICNGFQSMFCGSGGCTHKIYVGRSDGSSVSVGEFLAYGIEFDRPAESSFVVTSHGGDCNRAGAEGCKRRFRLDGDRPVIVGEVAAGPGGSDAGSDDRWTYSASTVSAAIGPDEQHLSLTCEGGAIRIRYSAPWMFDDGMINDHIREWDTGTGVVASFDVGGNETDVPMGLVEVERRLVARETIAVDARLLDRFAAGKWVTVHHGGSLEHELEFALDGSGAAIRSLRAACR